MPQPENVCERCCHQYGACTCIVTPRRPWQPPPESEETLWAWWQRINPDALSHAREEGRAEGYAAGLEKAVEIADAFMHESTKEAVEFGEPASSWGKVAAAGLIALAIRAALKSGPDTPNREGE
jgi:hypothetical protein